MTTSTRQLKQIVLDSSQYRYVNEDYLQTLPISIRETDERETIYDYEPHGIGIGYYDDPNILPFQQAFGDGLYWRSHKEREASTKHVTRLVIKNCEQLLALSYYDEGESESETEGEGESGGWEKSARDCEGLLNILREIYVAPLEPWISDSDDDNDDADADNNHGSGTVEACERESPKDEEDVVTPTLSKEDKRLLSILKKTINLEIECDDWRPTCSSYHDGKCLSACFLSLLLAFPNVKALRIKHLYLGNDKSLFANFPNPRQSSSSSSSSSSIPATTVSHHLEALSFNHCGGLHASDLPFLTDCAIEHAVLPNLRHLQCYYCNGMSYPSVVAASEALNLDFDRFEMSGWCWPQEAVNPKNQFIHY